jgi:peptide/nickel transport system ATP-binding protein
MTTTPGADTLVLRVRDLTVHFALPRRRPFAPVSYVHAVDGISFDVPRGTTFGLVGESGSGKSTAAQAIMRLIDPKAGTIELEGVDITSMKGEALRKMRRHFQIVFQDPYSSLNPRRSAGAVVREALDLLDVGNASDATTAWPNCFRPLASVQSSGSCSRTSSRAGSGNGSASPARWQATPA